jgi:ATP-binding cassette, subfamily B, bacterial
MTGPALSAPLLVPRSPTRGNSPERPTQWREKLAVLGSLPKLLALVWRTNRGYTAAMVGLRIVRAFLPVATLWIAKLILDVVTHAKPVAKGLTLWDYVAIEIALVIVGEFLARASALVESLLGDLFSNAVSERLMRHAATLDLALFVDRALFDHL